MDMSGYLLRIVSKKICFLSLALVCLLLASPGALLAGPIISSTRVTSVDVPAAVDPGRGDNTGAFWTFSELRSFALSPSPNGESKVGWQDVSGIIHVTPLTSGDERKADDILVGAGKLYDLVAHDNGFAVLIMKDTRMYVEKYNDAGTRIFRTELTDSDDRVDNWHTGKLAYDGTKYSAYFAIHGTAGWTEGHEGDKLKYIDPLGTIQLGGWEWGCSHSMDQRFVSSDSADIPICVSDCYPGKGIYLENRYQVSQAVGDCSGSTNARFGEAAMAGEHGVLVYLSIDGRSRWDVIFDSFAGSAPFAVRSEVALTSTPDKNEINPKVVPVADDKLLVSWETSDGGMRTFQFVDLDGNPLGAPEMVDVHAGPVNDFKIYPNGDIGWAYAWDDMNHLKIVRIQLQQGDLNGDGTIDLQDVIIGLNVLSGSNLIGITTDGDVNADHRIGMEEIVHDLKRISEE